MAVIGYSVIMCKPCLMLLSSFLWLIGLGVVAASDAKASTLFNFAEDRSSDLAPFPKWTGVLKRHSMNPPCGKTCAKDQWEQSLTTLKKKQSPLEQLRKVNQHFNASPYIEDIVNWGMTDYWETPNEFLKISGDCEDYAIVKYMSLKELGWSSDKMRVVILNDRHLNVLHAVLMVEEGGGHYILDNQIKQLMRDDEIHHYEPIYSINEEAWWRHLPR